MVFLWFFIESLFKGTLCLKILVLILILNASDVSAQQLPQHIELPELGLSFDIPEGWTGQLDGETIVMGHERIPGIMTAFQNHSKSTDELKKLAMEGIIDGGLQLTPSAEFTVNGEHKVSGNYIGTLNGTEVKSFATGLINGLGVGVNVVIIAEKNEFSEVHAEEVGKLIQSVKFYESRDSEPTMLWKKKIMGKQLKYLFTHSDSDYSGSTTSFSERRTVDLCTNGRYYYYSNTSNNINVGNSNAPQGDISAYKGSVFTDGTGHAEGTYQIYSLGNNSFLAFTTAEGDIIEYDLSADANGHTYLDGTRYLVLPSEKCY